MDTLFITRKPTSNETTQFQLAMSSFCDGSGQEREKDGTTRPGWRDFERIVAEVMEGDAPENKEIFDVVIHSKDSDKTDFGISVKSKEISRADGITSLSLDGRVYMELSNSPAKFWASLRPKNISEDDFRNQQEAKVIGDTILEVVSGWHKEAAKKYNLTHSDRKLDLEKSVFMTISYSQPRNNFLRQYQIHTFDMAFSEGIEWRFISDKCLRGFDPEHPDEALLDWYALSGGQLKYYPRASTARYFTEPFQLLIPKSVSIIEKTSIYWPKEWIAAGGKIIPTSGEIARAEKVLDDTLNR